MSQIDYSNPVVRKLVELTCGPEAVPQDGDLREISRDCEQAAIVIEGALSRYCGCPCRHQDDPICSTAMLPEDAVGFLPRTFAGFRPGDPSNPDPMSRAGMRNILAGTDAEFENSSFVYRFGYCPEEVPDAWDTLFREHRLPAPANPEACTPEVAVDEDMLNRPSIMWIEAGAAFGVLKDDHFPVRADLGIGGYAINGFLGGGEATFSYIPREGEEPAYLVGFRANAGYYIPFSASAGLQLSADLEVGGFWAGDASDIYFRMGPRTDLFMWFLEGFAASLGIGYLGTVTDVPFSRHSLDIIIRLYFGIL